MSCRYNIYRVDNGEVLRRYRYLENAIAYAIHYKRELGISVAIFDEKTREILNIEILSAEMEMINE